MHMGCNFTRTAASFWLPNVENSFRSNLKDFYVRRTILEEALQNIYGLEYFWLLPSWDVQKLARASAQIHFEMDISQGFSFANFDSDV